MSLKLVLLFALAALLGGCVTTGGSDDGLRRMERNQDTTRETAA
jgi:hypothetical protein